MVPVETFYILAMAAITAFIPVMQANCLIDCGKIFFPERERENSGAQDIIVGRKA